MRQNKDHDIRRADLVWLDNVADTSWVMDRMIDLICLANRETFGFDLTEFGESVQVAHYDGAREGHFDWHSDIGDGRLARKRKLTLVAQLSAPDSYIGGALEVMPSSHTVTAQRAWDGDDFPQLPFAPRDERQPCLHDRLGTWTCTPVT